MITITCIGVVEVRKQHYLFISVHTSARKVKAAQPAKPKYSTPTLVIGALRATPTTM